MTAYLAGLSTTLPMIAVQFFLARSLARKSAILSWAVRFGAGLLLVDCIMSAPGIDGDAHFPSWLTFFLFWWLFTSSFAYLFWVAIRLAGRAAAWRRPLNPSRRSALRALTYAGAAVPFAGSLYGAFIERTNFQVREIVIPIRDLPRDLENVRILQLTDVHLSAFLTRKELARAVDASLDLRPHIVLHTGDFISSRGDPLEASIGELSRVKGTEGVLGCLGNHETYAECEAYATGLAKKQGIEILRSQRRTIRIGGATLNVAGVDYQPFRQRERYLEHAENLVLPGATNILLSHNPDVFPAAASKGFDLTIAGHTHGGQVRIEILNHDLNVARFYTPYVSGLYRRDNAACYVSRGIGSIGMPARFGAPPEITLIRLSRI